MLISSASALHYDLELRESFYVMLLNRAHRVKGRVLISLGGAVLLPAEQVNPMYDRIGYEIQTFRVAEFVFFRHNTNISEISLAKHEKHEARTGTCALLMENWKIEILQSNSEKLTA